MLFRSTERIAFRIPTVIDTQLNCLTEKVLSFQQQSSECEHCHSMQAGQHAHLHLSTDICKKFILCVAYNLW